MNIGMKLGIKRRTRSFKFKLLTFLIVYGFINIIFFTQINLTISNANEIKEEFSFDKSSFEEELDLIGPFVFSIGSMVVSVLNFFRYSLLVVLEFILVLVFWILFFRSEVQESEKEKLSTYIKNFIISFLLICVLGTGIWSWKVGESFYKGLSRMGRFLFMYSCIFIFSLIFIHRRAKESTQQDNQDSIDNIESNYA